MNAAPTPKSIDPTSYPKGHPMFNALRLIERYWPLVYSKLLSLSWEWTDQTPYGATDGKRLLLNREGLNWLANQPNSAGLTAFLLVHEGLHALMGHGRRLAEVSHKEAANCAADYYVISGCPGKEVEDAQ